MPAKVQAFLLFKKMSFFGSLGMFAGIANIFRYLSKERYKNKVTFSLDLLRVPKTLIPSNPFL